MRRHVLAAIAVITGLTTWPVAAFATINSAQVSGTTITINGASFGMAKAPTVTLGGAAVKLGAYAAFIWNAQVAWSNLAVYAGTGGCAP